MTPKIEEGSVVQLKSGGPVMTVEDLVRDSARVIWYDDERRDFSRLDIAVHALQPYYRHP